MVWFVWSGCLLLQLFFLFEIIFSVLDYDVMIDSTPERATVIKLLRTDKKRHTAILRRGISHITHTFSTSPSYDIFSNFSQRSPVLIETSPHRYAISEYE
jgi:hypothetical protein